MNKLYNKNIKTIQGIINLKKINSKTIIFISMFLPNPLIPEAGQKLAYQRLKKMISDGFDVHLISFANEKEIEYIDYDNYKECKTVRILEINNLRRFKNLVLSPFIPISIAIRKDSRISKTLKKILDVEPNANIHIEYEQGLSNINKSYYKQTTIVLHDVMSQSVERFYHNEKKLIKKLYKKIQLTLIRTWEEKIKFVSKVIVLSQKDKDLLDKIANINSEKIEISYPLVSEDFRKVRRDRFNNNTAIFWGAMNRIENEDAVLWFINEIMPIVLNKIPDFKLYIVGAHPSEVITKMQNDNLVVTGFVESPIEYFEKAQIAIAPLKYGAGIKLKVLEALEAKLPVVATDVGSEGVIGQENLLYTENDIHSFAYKMIELMRCDNENINN